MGVMKAQYYGGPECDAARRCLQMKCNWGNETIKPSSMDWKYVDDDDSEAEQQSKDDDDGVPYNLSTVTFDPNVRGYDGYGRPIYDDEEEDQGGPGDDFPLNDPDTFGIPGSPGGVVHPGLLDGSFRL